MPRYDGPGAANESAQDHLRNALAMLRATNDLSARTGKVDVNTLHNTLEAVHRRIRRAMELIDERASPTTKGVPLR